MYVYEAIGDIAPVLHAFAKKGTKPHPYSERPYPISEKQIKREAEEKERRNAIKAKRIMEAFMHKTNARFKEESQNKQ